MRSIIALLIFLSAGNITFAQKITSSDTTRNKNQKSSVSNKILPDKDQEPQDVQITPGSSGVKRSIGYKFSSLQGDGDPGTGIFRYNNDNVSGVTFIFVDNNDLKGEDQTKWYATWNDTTGATGRGQLILADTKGKNVNIFNVNGIFIDGTGFWKIPVKYVSGTLPVDGSIYYYVFNRIAHTVASGRTNKENEAAKVTQTTAVAQATRATQAAQTTQTTQAAQRVQATQTTTATQTKQPAQTTRPYQTTQVTQGGQYSATQNNFQSQNIRRRKWYRGIIEIGYGLRVSEYGINNFRFNFINGFNIGHTSIGLGIGVRKYYDRPANHPDWHLFSGDIQMPVFLDIRTTFSSKKVTPYLALGIGNSAGYDTVENKSEGLFFHTSAGIWFNISDRFAVFAGLAYEMQKLEYVLISDDSHFKKIASSVSLNIGIAF